MPYIFWLLLGAATPVTLRFALGRILAAARARQRRDETNEILADLAYWLDEAADLRVGSVVQAHTSRRAA